MIPPLVIRPDRTSLHLMGYDNAPGRDVPSKALDAGLTHGDRVMMVTTMTLPQGNGKYPHRSICFGVEWPGSLAAQLL